ncbi:fibronectin type III domain-containing protein [Actinoplanes sp. NPDC051346]|uniref:fibronectin type III domain-containing protein n=1 Tax=Actinoplanes sp. NPDC051346 TaxID=3155048 RepID=UPI00342E3715
MGVRILAGTGAAAIAASLALSPAPAVAADAAAALPAPQGLTVTRAADDANKIVMSWQPVTGAEFYRIDTVTGTTETVTFVPGNTTSYTVAAPGGPCVEHKMRVATEGANGPGEYSPFAVARTLAPGGIMNAVPGRTGTNGTTGTISWDQPAWAGEGGLTGYRMQLVRYSDKVVLSDQVTTATSHQFPNLDPTRTYLVQVSPFNEHGTCADLMGKSLIDKHKPANPSDAVATRRPNSTLVDVTWKAPTTGVNPDYYLLVYGVDKPNQAQIKVMAPATAGTLNLALGKNWVVDVRAYNVNGSGSTLLNVTDPTAPVIVPPVVTPPTPPAPEKTPPTITAALTRGADRNGWHNGPVSVIFTCVDAQSGIADCSSPVTLNADGSDQVVTGTVTDKAGNVATTSMKVSLDRTAPTYTTSVDGTKNDAGWYRDAPTVNFACDDAASGVAECPAPVNVTTEGADQAVTRTVTDKAGNTNTASVNVSVDRTAPTYSTTVEGVKNDAGWYRTAPTVNFTCADAASGVAECPASVQLSTEGKDQSVTGTVTDKAGNTAAAAVNGLHVDTTAPTYTTTIDGIKNDAGWYRTAPSVNFTCADTVSGVAECPAPVTITDGVDQGAAGTVTDKAGNTTAAKVSGLNVDTAAPVVRIKGVSNGTNTLAAMPTPTCETVDAVSGVAKSAALSVTRDRDGHYTALCTGGTDAAGNVAAPVSASYTVAPTVTDLVAMTLRYTAANKASNGLEKDLTNKLQHGQYDLYISKVLKEPTDKKAGLTVTQAAELVYWARLLG